MVGGPTSLDELVDYVLAIGRAGCWTEYERAWKQARDAEKKRKSGQPSSLALWQAQAPEELAELSLAHSVATQQLFDNPLLGQGGVASRRDFAAGWRKARDKIRNVDEGPARNDLIGLLTGRACSILGDWNAGSWFSQANELYNFDVEQPSRRGQITPWAMLLACEGLVFFAGSASRRLGSRTRARAAFPFVTDAAWPQTTQTLTSEQGEVWLPLWSRPMTVPEMRSLFLRGRAELGGRGAVTPAAFAAAILGRGVDAGIDGFARFALGHTTNPKTFEARFTARVPVPSAIPVGGRDALPRVAEYFVEFIGSLPRDLRKPRDRGGRFVGLRGAVEWALTRYAGDPHDPELARKLLDAANQALARVDRGRRHREQGPSWRLLPLEWLPSLFGGDEPPLEARLAMAFAAVGARDPAAGQLLLYRFGLEPDGLRLTFPLQVPARRVWTGGLVQDDLARILRRRLIEAEQAGETGRPAVDDAVRLPFSSTIALSDYDVAQWLEGDADPDFTARWLQRMILFDWATIPPTVRQLSRGKGPRPPFGLLPLYGLFRPLLDPRPLETLDGEDLFPGASGARTLASARGLTALLDAGDLERAIALAFARYRMADHAPARFPSTWGGLTRIQSRLLVSSLLLQMDKSPLARLSQRWLRPRRQEGGQM